jgi:molybdopterin molybdotransferase
MDNKKHLEDMLGRSGLLERDAAQKLFLHHLPDQRRSAAEVDVRAAMGRVVSGDIPSPEDLPPFTRSTMDGYAVRASDTYGATESLPAYVNMVGEIPMGESPSGPVGEMETMKISTGGMLPEGADAVVMLEYTVVVDEKMVELSRAVAPGENVIHAGEDVRKGGAVLRAGHRIRPQDIGTLCGLGITNIPVYRRPRVAVVPTGNEIVPVDEVPGAGKVRDINSYHLSALIRQAGSVPLQYEVIPDDESRFREAVERALSEADVVILSGGSSVGPKDLTARVLSGLGKPGIIFHGVAVKPGKPTIGAVIDEKPVFGLPGHPASVVIGYELFVRPVLQILSGNAHSSWEPFPGPTVQAKMARSVASRAGREDYVSVSLERSGEELLARPVLGKSGLITTLVRADGTVVIPGNQLGLEQGDTVDVHLFD